MITEKDCLKIFEFAKKNDLKGLLNFIEEFSDEDINSVSRKDWLFIIITIIGTRVARDYESEQELAKILEENGWNQEDFIKYLREYRGIW